MGGTKKTKKRTKSETSPNSVSSSEKRYQIMSDITTPNPSLNGQNAIGMSMSTPIQNGHNPQSHGSFLSQMSQCPPGSFSSPQQYYTNYTGQQQLGSPQCQGINSNIQIIINKLELMEKHLGKLDNIEKQVSTMSQKMNSLDTRITFLENKVSDYNGTLTELQVSRSHDSATCDEILSKQASIDKILHEERSKSDRLTHDLNQLKFENERLCEEIIDLQGRSMRENLLFFNFDEEINFEVRKAEDCSSKIVNFCKDDLKIENVKIDRAHRVGKYTQGKTRPIVAKFHDPPVKESVKKSAIDNKDKTSKSVNDQFPKIVQERRRQLIPWMLKARYLNKRAVLDRDRLFIDNKLYTVSSLPIKELEHVRLPASRSNTSNMESSS